MLSTSGQIAVSRRRGRLRAVSSGWLRRTQSPARVRRLVLVATGTGSLMVPAHPRVLARMHLVSEADRMAPIVEAFLTAQPWSPAGSPDGAPDKPRARRKARA